eukprot:6204115-Pleurochrysis_carterae.AAC.4
MRVRANACLLFACVRAKRACNVCISTGSSKYLCSRVSVRLYDVIYACACRYSALYACPRVYHITPALRPLSPVASTTLFLVINQGKCIAAWWRYQ